MDRLAENASRVAGATFLMSEKNVRRQIALPWMTLNYREDKRSACAYLCRTTTITNRLHGGLSNFVAINAGENSFYENVSEYQER